MLIRACKQPSLYQSGVSSPVYNSTGTSWSASGFGNGSYTYTVHACNASGCSSASNAVTATVLHVPPAPSLSSSTTTRSTGGLTLSWTAATGAASYQVNVSANGGAWTAAWSGTGTSWSPSGLADGTYAYRVYGHNASGWGAPSNTVTVTVVRPSSWVTKPPALATVNVRFGMAWSAVSGATTYHVQQTQSGGTTPTTTIYSGTGTTTTVVLSGPIDHTFYYKVQACLSASQCSAWVEASTSGTYLQGRGTQNAVPASGSSVQ
jgi:hypothetical protein